MVLGAVSPVVLKATGGELSYQYVADPYVLSSGQTVGPAGGGTNVQLYGSFEPSFKTLSCRFDGSTTILATAISDTHISCVSPSLTTSNTSELSFPISNNIELTYNNLDFYDTGVIFEYYASPILTSVVPDFGPTVGGLMVRIKGTGFLPTSSSMCLFGRSMVPATYITSEIIECVTPSVSTGTYIYTYICMYLCICIYIHTYIHIYIHIYIYIQIHIYSYIYTSIHTYIYAYIHKYVYIHTYTGKFDLSYAQNGVDFDSKGLVYTYISGPGLLSLSPTAGMYIYIYIYVDIFHDVIIMVVIFMSFYSCLI
jgi:hypothetical protein